MPGFALANYSSRPARPTCIEMVRFFERGRESLRVEGRRDRRSGEFVLILHQTDGTRLVDRFKNESKFRKRLDALERQLRAARWTSRQSLEPVEIRVKPA